MPLVLSVAGGLLQQLGGRIDAEFVQMLGADNAEVLRERVGEFGDHLVGIEDLIISKSLDHCRGADKVHIVDLFHHFAIFPEDIPVPAALFDLLASVFGGEGKRPHLQVRSWLDALRKMALIMGRVTVRTCVQRVF